MPVENYNEKDFPKRFIKEYYGTLSTDKKEEIIDLLERSPIDKEELLKEAAENLYWFWNFGTDPEQTQRLKDIRDKFLGITIPYENSPLKKTIDDFWDKLSEDEKPIDLPGVALLVEKIMEFVELPKPDDTFITGDSSAEPLWRGMPRTYITATYQEDLTILALCIALKAGVLKEGMNLPLRRVWYALIKTFQQRGMKGFVKRDPKTAAGTPAEAEDTKYTSGFKKLIASSDLWYKTFGIHNPSAMALVQRPKLFKVPILIGLEKRSYYDVLQRMANLLGLSVYSAGGQSKFAEQEDLARKIHEQIYGENPELKGKDIEVYIISDFDPAGLDIGKNIGDHQSFYQSRFGRDLNIRRIAPYPDQYTTEELKQGVFDLKPKEVRKTSWKLPEIKKAREPVVDMLQEDDPTATDKEARVYGLEVESMPDKPLRDILKNPPTDWTEQGYDRDFDPDAGYKSLTRMRFILLDNLIENHGIEGAFETLLNQRTDPESSWNKSYDIDRLARKLIDKGEAKEVEDAIYDAYSMLSSLDDRVKSRINEYLEEDKEKVAEDITNWFDDVIKKYTDPEHDDYDEETTKDLKQSLLNKLYKAISRNENNFYFKFPDPYEIGKVKDEDGNYYEDNFLITIPDELIENIKPIITWANCIRLNALEVYSYLGDIEDDGMEIEWEIPPVRPCKINDDGEVELIELDDYSAPAEGTEAFRLAEMRKEKIEQLEKELAECKEDLEELTMAQEAIGESEECDELREKIKDLENELADLKREKEDIEQELNEEIARLERELEEAEKIEDTAKIEECQKKLAECEAALKKSKAGRAPLVAELLRLRKELEIKPTKERIVLGGKEITLEEEIERLEKRYPTMEWKSRKEAGYLYTFEDPYKDPFTYLEWIPIEKHDSRIIDIQIDVIKKEVEKDPARKKNKIMPLLNQMAKISTLISDKKTPFSELSKAHLEINNISKEIKQIHES